MPLGNVTATGPSLGAVANNTGLTNATLVASGVALGVPVALVVGSAKATMVVGTAAAGSLWWASSRKAEDKPLWPFGKKDEKKAEKKSSDSDSE